MAKSQQIEPGAILYMVKSDKFAVVPIRVIETVVRKRAHDSVVTHVVEYLDGERFELDTSSAKIGTATEARKCLQAMAKDSIDRMLTAAEEGVAKAWQHAQESKEQKV